MIDNTTRTQQARLIAHWMKAEGIRSINLGQGDAEFRFDWTEKGFYGSIVERQITDQEMVPEILAKDFVLWPEANVAVSIQHTVCNETLHANVRDLDHANHIAKNHQCKEKQV